MYKVNSTFFLYSQASKVYNNLGPNPILQELYLSDDNENIGNNEVASFLLQVGTKK
jgi:hypothetical protein